MPCPTTHTIRITTTPRGTGRGSTHCSSPAFPTTSSPVRFTISSAAVQASTLASSSTLAVAIRSNPHSTFLFFLKNFDFFFFFGGGGCFWELGIAFLGKIKIKISFCLVGWKMEGRRRKERFFFFFDIVILCCFGIGNCVVFFFGSGSCVFLKRESVCIWLPSKWRKGEGRCDR